MSIDRAFGYQSPETRALSAIDSTKYPDTNKDFEANIVRLNQFVDYIASYIGQMQKGIDQSNQDAIGQLQGTISDIIVLLGGGELLYGIDLGDLQYFLPAIGALLGFDTTTPFPINLFNAAEHFFLGYVVPLDSFGSVIEGIIDGWATALGIDPEWIQSVNDLLDAISGLAMSFEDLLTAVEDMIQIMGPFDQVFADIWHSVTVLLGGMDITTLGNLIDPVFKTTAPWIEELAQILNGLTAIIESFAGGVNDINGILNFASLFGNLNFVPSGTFDPIATISDWFTGTVSQTNVVALLSSDLTGGSGMGVTGVIPLENLAMDVISGIVGGTQVVWDAILASVGVPAGSGTQAQTTTYFTNLLSMFSNPALLATPFDPVTYVEDFITSLVQPTNLLAPMNPTTQLLSPVNIPGLDASKITSGQFLSSYLPIFQVFYKAGYNWVFDPSFEQNLNWPGAVGVLSTDVAHSGTKSLKVTATGTTQTMHMLRSDMGPQTLVVQPNYVFKQTAWIYPKVGNVGGGHIKLVMHCTDSKGVATPTDVIAQELAMPATGAWQQLGATVTVPTGFDTVDFLAVIESDIPANDVVYLDDLEVLDTNQSQSVYNQILQSVGVPPGVGTGAIAGQYFTDLMSMLGNPNVSQGGFSPTTAVTNFINTMINPTSLLAPMSPVTKLIPAINIPGLDASKITSGQFAQSMVNITSIAASIITGVLGAAQIPGLDASKITTGQFAQSMVNLTNIPASIVTGVLGATQIPGLDASKIISGQFAQSMVTNLTTDLANRVLTTTYNTLLNQLYGGTTVLSSILAGNVPALDASKITTGQFAQSMVNITNIPASIVTGALNAAQIPSLDASKIISGVFTVPLIPPLDASQIQSGMFGQWVLPNIPLGSIGQITPNLLPNPNYASAASVATNPDWTWTSGVDHTGDGSGSVSTSCTGALKNLLSDPPTPVAPNQTLALSHYLQWSGVTGSGNCFQLSVLAYNGPNLVSTNVLQTISNPAASGAWQQLSGNFTIPASGVNNVRLQLSVLAGATAGTTWWDDGSITKTQLLFKQWMQGTGGTLVNELATMVTDTQSRSTQADMMSLVNNLGIGSFANVGAALTPITNRLQGLPANGTVLAGFIPSLDATKIATGILGTARIPPVTLAMAPDLQTLNDNATNALVGAQTLLTGTTTAQANQSMQSIFTNVLYNTQALQQQAAINQGTSVSGVSITVNFAAYPDGAMPSFFTVTYNGPGTSQIGIKGGLAGWFPANNDGTRTAFVIYNAQGTLTDWQKISGSMSAAPAGANAGGQPYFYALGRVDSASNPRNYVFGRAYCTGFLTYKADVGYCVAGTETVWATGIALTWSTAMMVVIGANGNNRTFQVFSGTQLVWSGTEPGTNSLIGSGYRLFGAKNTICQGSGGSSTAGTLSGTSVSDNAPPTVLGSTFRAHRASTTAYTAPSGGLTALPAGFFDTQDWISPDLNWDGQNLKFTVEGTYLVNLRAAVNNIPRGVWADLGIVGSSIRVVGGSFADTGTSAQSNNGVYGSTLIYAHNGDSIQPATYASAAFSIVGEPGGSQTYMEVTLVNRSVA